MLTIAIVDGINSIRAATQDTWNYRLVLLSRNPTEVFSQHL